MGVVVIITRGDLDILWSLTLNIGDIWMLVAVCLWAAQTILIRFLPKGMDLVAFQVAAFVPGLVVSLPFYVLDTAKGHPMPLSLHAALSVAHAGLIASVLGFTCWNMGVMRVGPKTAGYFGSLYPIFGATLGILTGACAVSGHAAVARRS
jgi:drug/metabolite transporter (DMT)-like permease